jgi:DNA methylase
MNDLPAIISSLPPARTDSEWLQVAQTIHDLGVAELTTAQALKTIIEAHHQVQAYEHYVQLAIQDRDIKLQAANELNDLRIRQERWIGEWLAVLETRGSGRPKESVSAETVSLSLQSFGITRVQAHRWQTIASLPAPDFEAHVADRKAKGEELTTTAMYALAREVQKEAARQVKRAAADGPRPDDVTLWSGDFAEVGRQIPGSSVDLILTDPPYGEAFLSFLPALGALAARVLKPGGSLLVMYGQLHLYEALDALRQHLRYQWTFAYRFHGPGIAIWPQRTHNHWKPLLWFCQGAYDGSFQGDVLTGDGTDKRYHTWGQSVGAFVALIERLSFPGDVVLDPVCGGGTTGAAAVTTKRRFIGIDLDPEALAITRARLAALVNRS